MRKRKLQILLSSLGLLLFVFLIWLFADLGTGTNDETRYRHLGRTARSYAWLSSLDKKLPRPVARCLHLSQLEMSYQEKCEADLDPLIESGYLYGARFTVTNLAVSRRQVHNTVASALRGTGYWGSALNIRSNELTVYCRPQYVPRLQKALAQWARLHPDIHTRRSFLWEISRTLVARRYRNQSAASSPPMPSSSTSTLSTSSGRFGSCCSEGRHASAIISKLSRASCCNSS
jgi:hypothetical protein